MRNPKIKPPGRSFRYQLGGFRKAVSLKTKVEKDAIQKAEELLPMVKATSAEVVSAHVNEIRGWGAKEKKLLLCNAWEYYSTHPDRATPATVHAQLSYQATWGNLFSSSARNTATLEKSP